LRAHGVIYPTTIPSQLRRLHIFVSFSFDYKSINEVCSSTIANYNIRITPLVSSNVSHVGRIVNHRCLISGFIIVIKCETIIYLLILIDYNDISKFNFNNRG
jgi:hypothetical protein